MGGEMVPVFVQIAFGVVASLGVIVQVVVLVIVSPLRRATEINTGKLDSVLAQVHTINGRVGKVEQAVEDHNELDRERFKGIDRRLDHLASK